MVIFSKISDSKLEVIWQSKWKITVMIKSWTFNYMYLQIYNILIKQLHKYCSAIPLWGWKQTNEIWVKCKISYKLIELFFSVLSLFMKKWTQNSFFVMICMYRMFFTGILWMTNHSLLKCHHTENFGMALILVQRDIQLKTQLRS